MEKASDPNYLNFWNNTLTVLGFLISFLMTAVGTVTLGVDEMVHTVLAVIMFAAAVLHMLLFYFTLARVLDVTEFDVVLHRVCLFMTLPFNIFLLALIWIMYSYCTGDTCLQAAVDLVPAIEYSTAVFLLVYIFRFYNILKSTRLACVDIASEGRPCVPATGEFGYLGEETKHASEHYFEHSNPTYIPPEAKVRNSSEIDLEK